MGDGHAKLRLAVNSVEVEVRFEGPSGYIMAKFTNSTDGYGVTDVELPTSSDPMLGQWKMTATATGLADNQVEVQKSFAIDEYVLPKFEVKIAIAESGEDTYFTRERNEISGVVTGTYTYGKPVQGSLSMNLYQVLQFMIDRIKWGAN